LLLSELLNTMLETNSRVKKGTFMAALNETYTVLLPEKAFWRPSNIMKIPNTNLGEQLGASKLGARVWRLPPYSANTLHKHVEQEELYFVLEGTGRIRVCADSLTIPKYGAVLVAPEVLRQVFNDTGDEVLWMIVGAPWMEEIKSTMDLYPEGPSPLPKELQDHTWPPKDEVQ
jgi:mannose-6-phosphate isomerase-like protein (cupin superfamily)